MFYQTCEVCKLLEFKYVCHDGVDKLGDMILKNDSRHESFKKNCHFFARGSRIITKHIIKLERHR